MTITNLLTGKREKIVIVAGGHGHEFQTILLMKSKAKECIQKYYVKYKGAGARKLHQIISRAFTGVSEREVQHYINSQPRAQRVNPKFTNKVTPKLVQSSGVLNQVQIDLVDMSASPSSVTQDVAYKYILVVLDVFSRFCFLRPLHTESSAEVASRLIKIFSDVGPPLRIQSDQGAEFKGCVKKVMEAMKVKVIYSRPYHPQSQGKVTTSIVILTMSST